MQNTKEEQQLIDEAIESCERRGHEMGVFEPISLHTVVSYCLNCNKQVAVNFHPLPNEIDIGGEAVALNCQES